MKTTQPMTAQRRPWAEAALGLIAALVGIYGLGQGLAPLFGADHGGNLLWLVPAAIALFVLAAQMGRVQDTWPHRPKPVTADQTDDAPQKPPRKRETR